MSLADMLSPEVVKVPLISKTKAEVIRELVQLLADAGRIPESHAAYEAVLAREILGSTGLEMGVAVPHAKTFSAPDMTMAVGIAPQGIDFQSVDGKPSNLIILLLLAPPDRAGPHIEALAEVARIAKSPAFLHRVAGAATSHEVVKVFRGA